MSQRRFPGSSQNRSGARSAAVSQSSVSRGRPQCLGRTPESLTNRSARRKEHRRSGRTGRMRRVRLPAMPALHVHCMHVFRLRPSPYAALLTLPILSRTRRTRPCVAGGISAGSWFSVKRIPIFGAARKAHVLFRGHAPPTGLTARNPTINTLSDSMSTE
jgi:hypothetical protein